jgi:amino acid adenylation domain-containing protein
MQAIISGPAASPSDDDRRRLAAWNATASDYPRDKCMHQLFEEQAERTPDATALVFGKESLSYSELNARANRLARHLQKVGVGPDSLVGICLNRSLEMIVGILGTLKAGGAYVPLDPAYPEKRLSAMLEDVELKVLLTRHELANRLPKIRGRLLLIDREWDRIAATESDETRPSPATSQSFCYVIFTSGSTGKAKAAAVHHQGWMNLMHWFVTAFGIDRTDKVLVVSSFSFDITQRSIVMPLIVGGQLHLLASSIYDPALILRTVAQERITRMNCSPSTFYPLVEGTDRQAAYEQLRTLRTVFLGGEAISGSRLRDWAEAPGCVTEIVNVYGAAECSDVSSSYRLHDYGRYAASSVPIGTPIANSRILLVDEDMKPVPLGEAGEICIAGVGVGKGYINDPALTAAKFVPFPLGNDPATALLYRTGDLGRILPDMTLEFVGRADHQVKLRGFRIDLGDIETTLRQAPEAREVVVVKKEYGSGDHRLVAFLVPQAADAHPPEVIERVRFLAKDRLPDYMVPAEFIVLTELPLSPNGKVDRNALQAMETAGSSIQIGAEEPRTATERAVAQVFAKVLKLERVGVFDNFFDLGGYSTLLTEALSELSASIQHAELSIFDFLSGPTVAELAERIGVLAEEAADETNEEGASITLSA